MEASISQINSFDPGFPKRISAKNKCCQEYLDLQYTLAMKRAVQLEEEKLYTPQETMNL